MRKVLRNAQVDCSKAPRVEFERIMADNGSGEFSSCGVGR
jgi:hypothetical protein